jgi:hypothetical protein
LPDVIKQAQPPLEFIPPRFNPIVHQIARVVLPFWTRWRVQVAEIEVVNPEQLVDLYEQFQAGKIRFMMAFRHPSVNDPFSLFHLISQSVPKTAARSGKLLRSPVHSYFVYDRGIPLWAGRLVGWFLSQLGGTPIRRGKVDLPALRSIRQLFVEGEFPIAAAPEGATNGHSEVISPIEPGIAQFGFWCVEDLQKADRSEAVLIVPLGVRYHYVTPPWEAMDRLLCQLELDCGLSSPIEADLPMVNLTPEIAAIAPEHLQLYRRLLRLGEYLLTLMEQFYGKFYPQSLKPADPVCTDPNATFHDRVALRLSRLMDAALTVAEQYFGLSPKGSVTDRCRRVEQAGWDRIFREDVDDLAQLPAAEKGLADRIAEEADLRLWHMRLVETFVSVTGRYILEKPGAERLAETLLLVWDMVTRLKGKDATKRPALGKQRVKITIGTPLSVSDRWSDYQKNRRQAVATLTQDLQTALEKML